MSSTARLIMIRSGSALRPRIWSCTPSPRTVFEPRSYRLAARGRGLGWRRRPAGAAAGRSPEGSAAQAAGRAWLSARGDRDRTPRIRGGYSVSQTPEGDRCEDSLAEVLGEREEDAGLRVGKRVPASSGSRAGPVRPNSRHSGKPTRRGAVGSAGCSPAPKSAASLTLWAPDEAARLDLRPDLSTVPSALAALGVQGAVVGGALSPAADLPALVEGQLSLQGAGPEGRLCRRASGRACREAG